MKIVRRKTRVVTIGGIRIGASHPVAIQAMAKTRTAQAEATIEQVNQLEKAGCEIVRLAVKDRADAWALKKIKQSVRLPLVADIHFDWKLAIAAIECGVDKIRLNPGNIYKKEQIKEIVRAAKDASIPIRVGLNSGSLPGKKQGGRKDAVRGMVEGALDYIRTLEKFGFYDTVISLKASNILDTIEAYRRMGERCDYPFHVGLTATGVPFAGAIKSSIAIGALLLEGIGDTIRVSLTDVPEQEVRVAKAILEALQVRSFGPEVISCPTCGRCEVDLLKIVQSLEKNLQATGTGPQVKPLKVAVMGCVVNGPGEAGEADIGIAFGKKEGLLFRSGKPIKKVPFHRCVGVLLEEIKKGKR